MAGLLPGHPDRGRTASPAYARSPVMTPRVWQPLHYSATFLARGAFGFFLVRTQIIRPVEIARIDVARLDEVQHLDVSAGFRLDRFKLLGVHEALQRIDLMCREGVIMMMPFDVTVY